MRQLAKPTCDPRDDRLDLLREVVFLYATRLADGGLAARQALAGTYESRSPLRPRKNTQESPEKARNLGP